MWIKEENLTQREYNPKEHLSFTALGKFEKCPRGYWEEFVGNYDGSKPTKAMLVGQYFHACIEALGDEDEINEWVKHHKDSSRFFQKTKKDVMYADFNKALNTALEFIDLGVYPALDVEKRIKAAKETDVKKIKKMTYYDQELRLDGKIGNVPFVGVIDLLEVTDKTVTIRDWKYIKDFKRTYNESEHQYEEWYEKYIAQQLIYAKLLIDSQPHLADKPIICEIVGITKGDEFAVKRVHFSFNNIEELMDTGTWNVVASRARYAWNKLNKITAKDKKELEVCGECSWCKENHVIIDEELTID